MGGPHDQEETRPDGLAPELGGMGENRDTERKDDDGFHALTSPPLLDGSMPVPGWVAVTVTTGAAGVSSARNAACRWRTLHQRSAAAVSQLMAGGQARSRAAMLTPIVALPAWQKKNHIGTSSMRDGIQDRLAPGAAGLTGDFPASVLEAFPRLVAPVA